MEGILGAVGVPGLAPAQAGNPNALANRELSRNCLQMSVDRRNPAKGLIHHSDQGVAYTSSEWQKLMHRHERARQLLG
jgi:transposase InsO family protein